MGSRRLYSPVVTKRVHLGTRGMVAAGLAAIACLARPACVETAVQPTPFPLHVSADGRHLDDRLGQPFLIAGDTAWSLIAQLGAEDAAHYLGDRARRGFTAVIVNLIEHKFASHAPANRSGVPPFLSPGDFSQPNPAYFDAAYRVIDEAQRRHIAVWLCPAYLGWDGGDEGFSKEIVTAGSAGLRRYGRFVGARFRDLDNIVWMLGGDYALLPAQRWLADDLAAGLVEGGARQIMTAHGGQTTAIATYGQRPWLAIETVYSYKKDLRPELLAAYYATPVRPLVLIESTYEGEHEARPEQIRRQAWTAMLSGAAGQFFGNNPVWHFDGPTLFPFTGDWRRALDGAGSRDMSRLAAFFRARAWHRLSPTVGGALLAVEGTHPSALSVATSTDGKVVAYIASDDTMRPRELTWRLSSIPTSARWVNPARDEPDRPIERVGDGDGVVRLRTPGDNGAGANDWVLVGGGHGRPERP